MLPWAACAQKQNADKASQGGRAVGEDSDSDSESDDEEEELPMRIKLVQFASFILKFYCKRQSS